MFTLKIMCGLELFGESRHTCRAYIHQFQINVFTRLLIFFASNIAKSLEVSKKF